MQATLSKPDQIAIETPPSAISFPMDTLFPKVQYYDGVKFWSRGWQQAHFEFWIKHVSHSSEHGATLKASAVHIYETGDLPQHSRDIEQLWKVERYPWSLIPKTPLLIWPKRQFKYKEQILTVLDCSISDEKIKTLVGVYQCGKCHHSGHLQEFYDTNSVRDKETGLWIDNKLIGCRKCGSIYVKQVGQDQSHVGERQITFKVMWGER